MTLEQRLTGLAFRVHIGHKGEFAGRDKELQRSKNNSRPEVHVIARVPASALRG